MIRITVEGDDALVAALNALDDKVRRRITRFALNKAGAPVAADAAARVRAISPTIADAMTTQIQTLERGKFFVLKIGPVRDKSAAKPFARLNPITGKRHSGVHNPDKTAHLVEGGTQPHRIRMWRGFTIQHPGAKAHPYLAPALESQRYEAIGKFQQEAWAAIARAARREERKAAKALKARQAVNYEG